MAEESVETLRAAVYRVAVRLPPLWPDRPDVWFAQAEAQFELAAIRRQRRKFNYVVAQPNQQEAAWVEDITSPPEHEPYNQLKAELVRRLSTSREQSERQLLSDEEMGDRKPSQFLRHLKGLAPGIPDDFLLTIWANRLPPHVQAILAGQTEGSLDSASHLADRIREITPIPTTASISPPRRPTAQPCYKNVSRNSRARLSHCGHHGPTTARSPEAATACTPEITAAAIPTLGHPTTPAGTTDVSGTPPENSHHRPSSSRKNPPAGVNGR